MKGEETPSQDIEPRCFSFNLRVRVSLDHAISALRFPGEIAGVFVFGSDIVMLRD